MKKPLILICFLVIVSFSSADLFIFTENSFQTCSRHIKSCAPNFSGTKLGGGRESHRLEKSFPKSSNSMSTLLGTLSPSPASESQPDLLWSQNMTSFGNWNQLNGDPKFDPDGDDREYEYDIEIENSIVPHGWTPANYSTRSNFWEYEGDVYRYAGLYRLEPALQDDSWEFMTKVYFDTSYQGNISSSSCNMHISIYNENFEPMYCAQIRDGSSSTSNHQLFGRVLYYPEKNDSTREVIDTSRNFDDSDVDNDSFGIKINTSDNIYVYFPSKVPDGGDWSISTTESNARARGTMTYLVLTWFKWYEAPVDAQFTELKFYSPNASKESVSSPPQNLQAVAGDNKVYLSWEPPSDHGNTDIIEYRIYRSTYPSHYTLLAITTSTDFTDATVGNRLTYYYVVTAVNLVGESDLSNQVIATPVYSTTEYSSSELQSSTSMEKTVQITSGFSILLITLPVIFITSVMKKKCHKKR